MKVRSGFVSNSSSSSFIVVGMAPSNVGFAKITEENVIKKIASRIEVPFDEIKNKDIYLTEFVADCEDKYGDFIQDEAVPSKYESYHYSEGNCYPSPYDEDSYIEIEDNVFLFKSDSEDFQVYLNDLCASLSYLIVRDSKEIPENLDQILKKFKEGVIKKFKNEDSLLVNVESLENLLTKSINKIKELKHLYKDDDSCCNASSCLFSDGSLVDHMVEFLKSDFINLRERDCSC